MPPYVRVVASSSARSSWCNSSLPVSILVRFFALPTLADQQQNDLGVKNDWNWPLITTSTSIESLVTLTAKKGSQECVSPLKRARTTGIRVIISTSYIWYMHIIVL